MMCQKSTKWFRFRNATANSNAITNASPNKTQDDYRESELVEATTDWRDFQIEEPFRRSALLVQLFGHHGHLCKRVAVAHFRAHGVVLATHSKTQRLYHQRKYHHNHRIHWVH